MPGAIRVSPVIPEPAQPQGQSCALDVLDAKAPVGNRPAHATPTDMATATIGGGASLPHETSLDFLDELDGLLKGGRRQVGGG